MLWVCAAHSINEEPVLLLLLGRTYTESRPFPLLISPESELEVFKEFEEDTAGTSDPK